MSIGAAARLGIQGLFDVGMNKVFGGVISGTGGFVSGAARGLAGASSTAYSRAGIGKVTHAMGHAMGSAGNTVARGVVGVGAGVGVGIGRSLPRDLSWFSRTSYGAFNSLTRPVTQELRDMGYYGIAGRIAKPGVAWGVGGAALVLGGMNGVGDFDYNMGLKTVVNGMMDTEGVSLTPGMINPSYTPITSKRKPNNGIRDLGTSGDLGFALHNQRSTGQI